ncbi:hypothetical protein OS493_008160 [Desmophyllum pertusum]|uniref:Uncharacterized protein n=1 Tax=Desmophyllum pertusum TaxID=174260 RepID=A0A9X0A4I0_9CNID|nr:hypothetical protein OS493_008160 [Desmophyllum pertusum]
MTIRTTENKTVFNNNYVTIIDNIDGKDTADSYSSLSSDEAKNEYTNVENSINEGANEESQMLGKEVNDVLGALTKSDSRIGQVVGTKLPQAQPGGLPFKQTLSSYNDKGDDVAIVDDGREEGKNSQSRPLQAHPGALSFMQALSPYNDKANDVSSVDDGREEGSQSRPPQAHPGGLSYMQALSPPYNDKGNDVATMHDGREEGSQNHPPQAHPGGLPFKQTISPYNDKGDAGAIMDDGREEGKYTQGRPPGDITVIEDEEVNPKEETSPVLSAPVWNAIQLAEQKLHFST